MMFGTCGKNLTWTLDYRGMLTINGKGKMDDYDFGYKSPSPWINQRDLIKKVVIENGITSIGERAFNFCTRLTSITIPDSVTSIGDWALCACESLTSITIPNSVTSIGEGAFSGCWNLTSVTILGNITIIAKETFRNCRSLTNVTILGNVKTIGDSAFRGCGLTNVTIPDTVTTIDEWAFSECIRLESVIIPDSVKSINWAAFIGCSNLKSVTIPSSVTKVGNAVFDGCKQLKEIYYPAGRGFEVRLSQNNNAKLIPYNTAPVVEKLHWKVEGKTLTVGGVREIKYFSEPPWVDSIYDVQKIVIEEGVEKISANAFLDCSRLELLTIPASVKTIGDTAFTACYCGDRLENGGRNIFWCLEDGVLILKKNPAAKSDSDFSTGSVSWLAVEKNITGFKLEPGVVPKEKFFEWLSKRGKGEHVSFS